MLFKKTEGFYPYYWLNRNIAPWAGELKGTVAACVKSLCNS